MDFRRVRVPEMLTLVGGVALLVSLFLPWYDYSSGQLNGWSALTGALVPLLITAVLGIYLFVITLTRSSPALPVAAGVWTTFWAMIGSVFALVHVLALPGGAHDRCYGLWIGFAATLLVLVGAWLSMRDDSPRRGVAATVATS
jgi:hypothetical protein